MLVRHNLLFLFFLLLFDDVRIMKNFSFRFRCCWVFSLNKSAFFFVCSLSFLCEKLWCLPIIMEGLSQRVEWYVSWIMDDFFSRCFRTLLQSLQNRLPIDKAAMATGWDEQREINSQFIQFSQLEYEKMYMMATNAMQIPSYDFFHLNVQYCDFCCWVQRHEATQTEKQSELSFLDQSSQEWTFLLPFAAKSSLFCRCCCSSIEWNETTEEEGSEIKIHEHIE